MEDDDPANDCLGYLFAAVATAPVLAQTPAPQPDQLSAFAKQILVPDLYENERESDIQPRPEIFIQTRFSRGSSMARPSTTPRRISR